MWMIPDEDAKESHGNGGDVEGKAVVLKIHRRQELFFFCGAANYINQVSSGDGNQTRPL